MPRPPILTPIDWKAVFAGGKDFNTWLRDAENAEHRDQMQKALDSLKVTPEREGFLRALSRDVHVIAIAEDWCGDVVRHVPVLERLARVSSRIKTRYIGREDNRELFARYLTNGGEAIPKFVFLSDQFVECGNWGPMPTDCRRLIGRGKAAGDVGAARKKVSALYEMDVNRDVVICELMELIETAVCTAP